jgi:hypothetical protein
MEDAEYGLIMKFLDSSPSFTHGYEMGMLHMRMQAGEEIQNLSVHRANKEQIEMLARSSIASDHGYVLTWTEWDEDWLILTATPPATKADPRNRLQVIEGGLAVNKKLPK